MRQTLATFELNAGEWDQWAISPSIHDSTIGGTVAAGVAAYAHKQAHIQHRLIEVFVNDWYRILEKQPSIIPWLNRYPCPHKNQHHCLISNVQFCHLTPPPHAVDPHVHNVSPDGVDAVSLDTPTDQLSGIFMTSNEIS